MLLCSCEACPAPSGAATWRWYPWAAKKARSKDRAFFMLFSGCYCKIANLIFSRSTNIRAPRPAFAPGGLSENCKLDTIIRSEGGHFCLPHRTQQNLCHFVAFVRSEYNRLLYSPSEPLRCPLATCGGCGLVLTLNKIMVLFRSPFCPCFSFL